MDQSGPIPHRLYCWAEETGRSTHLRISAIVLRAVTTDHLAYVRINRDRQSLDTETPLFMTVRVIRR